MIPAAFEYHAPATLKEATALMRRFGDDAKVLAGGQSLIPMMKLRLADVPHLIDLRRVSGLAYIKEQDGGLAIGAMTTYHELEASSLVRRYAPFIVEAIDLIADVQVRNKGTIGGSAAHADPAADLPALLVALEARINTTGGARARHIAADRFFVDAYTTAMGPSEVISEITLPALPLRTGTSYRKFANKASHFAVVGAAAVVTLGADGLCERVRLGITGAGPKAARSKRAERYLEGKAPTQENFQTAARKAGHGIEFLEDIHGSAEYRRHLTSVFAARALAEAVQRVAD
ncbi:MAG: carbon-monoxide dehydrogenase medium subunit [Chloroflexi bacterium]|jgi:carbon-monoxide dehydrogenase medium subunit|nr:MAG: carbon-monoxide dehydrogenase medium subunit [Chloroflexota bacterium]